MTLQRLPRSSATLVAALVTCLAMASPGLSQIVACEPGTDVTFAVGPTGPQTYMVPNDAIRVAIVAAGAAGGDSLPAPEPGPGSPGGAGAVVSAEFPVLGGEAFDVFVGARGATVESNGAGGGGGSFVSLQGSLALWIAAGGGGGGGISQAGKGANVENDGVSSDGPCGGAGGTGGNGGAASDSTCAARGVPLDAGGGGGWLSAGGDGDGLGGDRVSPPGTAAGGAGSDGNDGGFGGGGGGSALGGGGGGGYSGGGGGFGQGADGGGGGGSFLLPQAILLSAGVSNLGDGQVFICVAERSGEDLLAVPTGGPWTKALLAVLLALATLTVMRRST